MLFNTNRAYTHTYMQTCIHYTYACMYIKMLHYFIVIQDIKNTMYDIYADRKYVKLKGKQLCQRGSMIKYELNMAN